MKPFVLAKRLPTTGRRANMANHPLIQFFISYDTFGTVWYKGIAFNLKDQIDYDVLLMWLVVDGWVSFGDVADYPYNSGYDTMETFTVHHPKYTYIRYEPQRFFWYNLLDRLLPQLEDKELAYFNRERKERYHAILQRNNSTQL